MSLREELEKLVAEWREDAEHRCGDSDCIMCAADEVSALLDARPAPEAGKSVRLTCPKCGGKAAVNRSGRLWPHGSCVDVLAPAPAPEAGVTLTKAERSDLVDAYDHEAEANCWRGCEDGLFTAVERILAARHAPTVAPDVETLAEVLYERFTANRIAEWDDLEPDGRTPYLDAAVAVVAGDRRRSEAEVKAEALREAADLCHHADQARCTWVDCPCRAINALAARIAEGGEG